MIAPTCWCAALAPLLCLPALLAAQSPQQPQPSFSIVSILRHPQALDRPHDVAVRGGLMCVPGKGGTIAVADVRDPAHPEIVWWTRQPGDDAQTVLCHGQHLLVGTRDFLSIDIADPQHARVCKRLRDRPRIDRINGMIPWGDHVLYANKAGWIGAIRVDQPDASILAGALNTREHGEIISPHDIARYRHCAIVVDQRDRSRWKLRAYRVADPQTGELLSPEQWQPKGAVAGDRLNGANRVLVCGDYALIACNKANTLAVVDFSDLGDPATVCVLPFPGAPCGLTLAGNVLFAAGGQSVQALDITDPRKPVTLATFESAEVFPTKFATGPGGKRKYTTKGGTRQPVRGNAHDLVYQEDILYVTAQDDDQVAILRVEDPRIRRLADGPPSDFRGASIPVECSNPVTMTPRRRVRPQALVFDNAGTRAQLLYTTDGSGGVSIATALAETPDGGTTWTDHPANPVLNRIESDWQGNRAFVTALA